MFLRSQYLDFFCILNDSIFTIFFFPCETNSFFTGLTQALNMVMNVIVFMPFINMLRWFYSINNLCDDEIKSLHYSSELGFINLAIARVPTCRTLHRIYFRFELDFSRFVILNCDSIFYFEQTNNRGKVFIAFLTIKFKLNFSTHVFCLYL